jgi:hypothetical protein
VRQKPPTSFAIAGTPNALTVLESDGWDEYSEPRFRSVEQGDALAQREFIHSIFGVAA